MKNTKHTEINDPSVETDENTSQSKRKLLTSLGATSGVIGATALAPEAWVKPIVNSIVLPAHASHSPTHLEITATVPETFLGDDGNPEIKVDTTVNVKVTLSAAPTEDVIVTVTSSDGEIVGVDGKGETAPVTIVSGSTEKSVMLSAEGEAGQSANVTFVAEGFISDTLTVTIIAE